MIRPPSRKKLCNAQILFGWFFYRLKAMFRLACFDDCHRGREGLYCKATSVRANEEVSMDEPRVFKKYANRRIYDTHSSSYVTLGELAAVIRQGQEVKVVDAKTKADVTAFILTQIVLEQAKRNNTLLPVPILHLIIRYGDNVLLEFFETYLQQIVRNYLHYKNAFDAQFQQWLDLGMGFSGMGAGGNPESNLFRSFFSDPTKDGKKQDD
jgi:polyhydroxyalkanoate synthesis repressor PhaR